MATNFQLTSWDFRGVLSRRFLQNFIPIPAQSRFALAAPLPNFELPVAGQRASIKLSDYRRQKLVVLAFTRIFTEKQYCPFCYPHLLSLVEAYDRFVELGAEVLLITSTDRQQSEIVRRDLGLPMPLLIDARCQVFRQYGTGQALGAPLPAQFVIDYDGNLRFQHLFSFAHTNASPERLMWAVRNC